MTIRTRSIAVAFVLLASSAGRAQDAYKVERGKEAPPSDLPASIAEVLAPEGYRILKPDGKPLADLWLRKAIPARTRPAGPEGAVQFPFLVPGELLGAIRYHDEGHDYRDQAIVPGTYTIRFGLHPVNGDHLGVSPFRDYGLLVPASLEKGPGTIGPKELEHDSAEAAGTNHPAVLLLTSVTGSSSPGGAFRDDSKGFSGIVLPLSLKVDDEPVSEPYPVGLIYDGVAAQ